MSRDKFFVVDAEFAWLTALERLILRNHKFAVDGWNDWKLSRTAKTIAKCSVLQNAKRTLEAADYYTAEQLRIS